MGGGASSRSYSQAKIDAINKEIAEIQEFEKQRKTQLSNMIEKNVSTNIQMLKSLIFSFRGLKFEHEYVKHSIFCDDKGSYQCLEYWLLYSAKNNYYILLYDMGINEINFVEKYNINIYKINKQVFSQIKKLDKNFIPYVGNELYDVIDDYTDVEQADVEQADVEQADAEQTDTKLSYYEFMDKHLKDVISKAILIKNICHFTEFMSWRLQLKKYVYKSKILLNIGKNLNIWVQFVSYPDVKIGFDKYKSKPANTNYQNIKNIAEIFGNLIEEVEDDVESSKQDM